MVHLQFAVPVQHMHEGKIVVHKLGTYNYHSHSLDGGSASINVSMSHLRNPHLSVRLVATKPRLSFELHCAVCCAGKLHRMLCPITERRATPRETRDQCGVSRNYKFSAGASCVPAFCARAESTHDIIHDYLKCHDSNAIYLRGHTAHCCCGLFSHD